MLRDHEHDLGAFITNDPKGRLVPAFLAQLCEVLFEEQAKAVRELDSLTTNVAHIKEIVAMQQDYARVAGVKEFVNVQDLIEDSLRLNLESFGRHGIEITRDYQKVPAINLEKHKLLQILVNLIRNAKHACAESGRGDKRVVVRVANEDGRIKISVTDNGVGIPRENLTRIFNHGFTTRKHGHGFGLHSGALAAKELGGSLTVHSEGQGLGAAFIVDLPTSSSN
jgi:C4-dicarboxylate-specific signal transduction histidine kinase